MKNNIYFENFIQYCDAEGLVWHENDKVYIIRKAMSIKTIKFLFILTNGYLLGTISGASNNSVYSNPTGVNAGAYFKNYKEAFDYIILNGEI